MNFLSRHLFSFYYCTLGTDFVFFCLPDHWIGEFDDYITALLGTCVKLHICTSTNVLEHARGANLIALSSVVLVNSLCTEEQYLLAFLV
jgi:hypothetical protein